MSGTHPLDETLQQFVLDRATCTPEEIGHIESCPDCRAAAAAYRLLVNAVQELPVPAFDVDLAAAVIRQLKPQPALPPKRKERSMLTPVLIVLAIVIPAFLFWRSAYFVFTDMSAVFYWSLLAAAAVIVGFSLLRLHKKYQDVINLINK